MKSNLNYRSDIDGLRGIAVLFVIVFHASANLLSGGFIGVDIFFVISGYLISSIILKDLAADKFTIHAFYARRIKRIFPALIVVLVVTCALGWLLLFPDEFKNLGKHVVGGATFVSNILLSRETGYFDGNAELKPLLHLWSLGIEEQFYMFFPLLLWLAYRKGFATPRFLVALLAISFGLSVVGTFARPTATFYLPITRLWELLVGCILAAIENRRKNCSVVESTCVAAGTVSSAARMVSNSNLISCLGIALILGGGLCLNKSNAFPGGWALLPCLGTAMVIWGGRESFVNRWIFGSKILVGVGLISYPLYLWHWPLLYFGRIITPDGLSNLAIVAILAVSGLLAWITFLFVESPIRFGRVLGEKKVLWLASCMAGILIFGLLAMRGGLSSRLGQNPLSSEAGKAAAEWFYPFHDNFKLASGFKKDAAIMNGKADKAILFVGDSHMQYYWPRIELIAHELGSKTRPMLFVTAGGSPALPNVNRLDRGYACNKFFGFAMQEASLTNVSTVVFSCAWEQYFIGSYPGGQVAELYRVGDKERTPLRLGSPAANQVFAEFGQEVAKLTRMGKEVVVILPAPSCSAWAPGSISRLASYTAFTNQVKVGRKDFEVFIHPVKQALIDSVTANGGRIIDPLDYFEEDGSFNGKSVDGRFRYKDSNHFREFYVEERATFLDALLVR